MPQPDPFAARLDSPLGPLGIRVLPGRAAEVGCAEGEAPLSLDGCAFGLRARYERGRRGWRLKGLRLHGPGALPGHVGVAAALGRAVPAALDALGRRFVERDIVEIMVERRAEAEALDRLREEIARRRAKLRRMNRDAAGAAAARGARLAALRAELDAAPGGPQASPPGEGCRSRARGMPGVAGSSADLTGG